MTLIVLARGESLPQEVLLPAFAAGLLMVVTLAAYYQALAIGVMSIIGPIFSLSIAVPVIVGLARGERPTAVQFTGIVIALGGVFLASREKSAGAHHKATSRASVGLALLSGTAYGFVMVFYAQGAEADPYWSIALSRLTSAAVFALAFAVMRPSLRYVKGAAAPLLAIGVFEVGAFTLFSVASTYAYLSVVSVLGSVYPVFLALLAAVFLRERLAGAQVVGVIATLVGVALIASG